MLQQQYQEHLKQLFDQLPSVKISTENTSLEGQEIKIITYSLFEIFVSKMMASAYYDGKIEAIDGLEQIMETSFK